MSVTEEVPKLKTDKLAAKIKGLKANFSEEVKALGGSKEDVEMLKNLNDDDDGDMTFGPDSKADESLVGDVSKFLDELGLVDDGPSKVSKKKDKKDKLEDQSKTKKNTTKDTKEAPAQSKKSKADLGSAEKNSEDVKPREKNGTKAKKLDKQQPDNKKATGLNNKTANKNKNKNDTEAQRPKKTIFEPSEIKETVVLTHPGQLVLEPRNDWYNLDDKLPEDSDSNTSPDTEGLFTAAKRLLEKENEVYIHDSNKSTSQKQFLSQLLSAGTLTDKISALTLLIQESPLHSMKYFDMLLGLCKKKSRGSAMQAVTALKDVFLGGVLPDRKLKWFKNQPVSDKVPMSWLIVWAFEDWLKQYFFSLLQLVEGLSHDPVVFIRTNSVNCIIDLLKGKPEQEVNLLRLGVNKLGDADRKVASKVSQLILHLEEAHPAMKQVISNAVSELIFRPGADYHARYFAVVTLSQTILSTRETELANMLVKLYLTLFERLLTEWDKQNKGEGNQDAEAKPKKARWKNKPKRGKKGGIKQAVKTNAAAQEEENAKLTSAILTGLNRAFPYADLSRDVFENHIEALYRVTHSANFGTSVQALMLVFQVIKKQKSLSDRYYRTLYESLFDPRLVTSSKLRLYLNLVFRSLRDDGNKDRVRAFVKRLLQVADHLLNIGMVAAVMFLINEVSKTFKGLAELISSQEPIEEDDDKAGYDGKARDPRFAKANNSRLWELVPLLNHFHPTVAVYAHQLFQKNRNMTQPDLNLHTLAHFLDRFVYRNPKQKVSDKGGSIMQPLAGSDISTSVFKLGGIQGAPVTSTNWSKIDISKVDASERFFYQYFINRSSGSREKSSKKTAEETGLDEKEDEVWDAIVKSNPTLEAENGGFSDEDISFSDMSDFNGDEDDELKSDQEVEDMDSDDFGNEDEEEEEGSDESEQADEDSDDEGMISSEALLDRGSLKNKRDRSEQEGKTAKRRKLKDLPTFASAEDFAQYLGSDEE